jgi:hypothetical protein
MAAIGLDKVLVGQAHALLEARTFDIFNEHKSIKTLASHGEVLGY